MNDQEAVELPVQQTVTKVALLIWSLSQRYKSQTSYLNCIDFHKFLTQLVSALWVNCKWTRKEEITSLILFLNLLFWFSFPKSINFHILVNLSALKLPELI